MELEMGFEDPKAYTVAMAVCGRSEHWREALDIFCRAKQRGLVDDVIYREAREMKSRLFLYLFMRL